MSNQIQNLNQNSEQGQNQNNQKTFLSSLTAKIILALIIFAGSAIIIISGTKFITENYKTQNNNKTVDQKGNEFYCEIDSDCVPTTHECGECSDNTIAINKKYLEKYQKNWHW